MNLFAAGPGRNQPKLTDHLQDLRQDLDDLGEKLRDCIAETVGRALASFVRQGVRSFLARVGARPGLSSRTLPLDTTREDERDPYEDFEAYPEEIGPPEVSTPGRGVTSRLGSWRRLDLLGLGAVLCAGLGVLRSVVGLLALADGASLGITALSALIGV